jgi:hypothetical protein
MGPRSTGFDELEAGYPAITDDEPGEPAFAAEDDEDGDEAPASGKGEVEMDELEMAEQDYLREIHSGMVVSEEEDLAV